MSNTETGTPLESNDPLNQIASTIAFLGSCIRCGERFDETCKIATDKAFENIKSLQQKIHAAGTACYEKGHEHGRADALCHAREGRLDEITPIVAKIMGA